MVVGVRLSGNGTRVLQVLGTSSSSSSSSTDIDIVHDKNNNNNDNNDDDDNNNDDNNNDDNNNNYLRKKRRSKSASAPRLSRRNNRNERRDDDSSNNSNDNNSNNSNNNRNNSSSNSNDREQCSEEELNNNSNPQYDDEVDVENSNDSRHTRSSTTSRTQTSLSSSSKRSMFGIPGVRRSRSQSSSKRSFGSRSSSRGRNSAQHEKRPQKYDYEDGSEQHYQQQQQHPRETTGVGTRSCLAFVFPNNHQKQRTGMHFLPSTRTGSSNGNGTGADQSNHNGSWRSGGGGGPPPPSSSSANGTSSSGGPRPQYTSTRQLAAAGSSGGAGPAAYHHRDVEEPPPPSVADDAPGLAEWGDAWVATTTTDAAITPTRDPPSSSRNLPFEDDDEHYNDNDAGHHQPSVSFHPSSLPKPNTVSTELRSASAVMTMPLSHEKAAAAMNNNTSYSSPLATPPVSLLTPPQPSDRSIRNRLKMEREKRDRNARLGLYEGEMEPAGVRGQEAQPLPENNNNNNNTPTTPIIRGGGNSNSNHHNSHHRHQQQQQQTAPQDELPTLRTFSPTNSSKNKKLTVQIVYPTEENEDSDCDDEHDENHNNNNRTISATPNNSNHRLPPTPLDKQSQPSVFRYPLPATAAKSDSASQSSSSVSSTASDNIVELIRNELIAAGSSSITSLQQQQRHQQQHDHSHRRLEEEEDYDYTTNQQHNSPTMTTTPIRPRTTTTTKSKEQEQQEMMAADMRGGILSDSTRSDEAIRNMLPDLIPSSGEDDDDDDRNRKNRQPLENSNNSDSFGVINTTSSSRDITEVHENLTRNRNQRSSSQQEHNMLRVNATTPTSLVIQQQQENNNHHHQYRPDPLTIDGLSPAAAAAAAVAATFSPSVYHPRSPSRSEQQQTHEYPMSPAAPNTPRIASSANDSSACTPQNVHAINALAMEHVHNGEFDMALAAFTRVLQMQKQRYGDIHPAVASAHHNLGTVHSKRASILMEDSAQQRHCRALALECFQAAARTARDSLGRTHPNVAVSLVRIGFLLLQSRQYQNAIVTFKEALRIRLSHYGAQHGLVANLYNNLGVCNMHLGNFQDGRDFLEAALEIQRDLCGAVQVQHPSSSSSTSPHSVSSQQQQENEDALILHRLELADTLFNIGGLCLEWIRQKGPDARRAVDAEEAFAEALTIRTKSLGPEDPIVLQVKALLDMARAVPRPKTATPLKPSSILRGNSGGDRPSPAAATTTPPSSAAKREDPSTAAYRAVEQATADFRASLPPTPTVSTPPTFANRHDNEGDANNNNNHHHHLLGKQQQQQHSASKDTPVQDPPSLQQIKRPDAEPMAAEASPSAMPFDERAETERLRRKSPSSAAENDTVDRLRNLLGGGSSSSSNNNNYHLRRAPENDTFQPKVVSIDETSNSIHTTGQTGSLRFSPSDDDFAPKKGAAASGQPSTPKTNNTSKGQPISIFREKIRVTIDTPKKNARAAQPPPVLEVSVSKDDMDNDDESVSDTLGSYVAPPRNSASTRIFMAPHLVPLSPNNRKNNTNTSNNVSALSDEAVVAAGAAANDTNDGQVINSSISISKKELSASFEPDESLEVTASGTIQKAYSYDAEENCMITDTGVDSGQGKIHYPISWSKAGIKTEETGDSSRRDIMVTRPFRGQEDPPTRARCPPVDASGKKKTVRLHKKSDKNGVNGKGDDGSTDSNKWGSETVNFATGNKERDELMKRARAILQSHQGQGLSDQEEEEDGGDDNDDEDGTTPTKLAPSRLTGFNGEKVTAKFGQDVLEDGLAPLRGDWPRPNKDTSMSIREMVEDPMNNLHGIYDEASRKLKSNEHVDSLSLFDVILQCQRRKHGHLHPDVASALHNTGIAQLRALNHSEALKAFEEAARIRKGALGRDHPEVAVSLVKVGITLLLLHRFEDALWSFREALSVRKHAMGSLHPSTARIYNNIGCVHVEFNEFREARRAFEAALDIQRNALAHDPDSGPLMFATATTLCNLGYLYRYRDHHGKAALVLKEAVDLQESVLGRSHPTVLSTLDNLADSCANSGHTPDALRYYNMILERFRAGAKTETTGNKMLLRAEAVLLYKISRVHRQRNDREAQLDSLKLALQSIRAYSEINGIASGNRTTDTLERRIQYDIRSCREQLEKEELKWV